MLTEKQIQDFQNIYEKQFGKQITKVEAIRLGCKLVELIRLFKSLSVNEVNKNK